MLPPLLLFGQVRTQGKGISGEDPKAEDGLSLPEGEQHYASHGGRSSQIDKSKHCHSSFSSLEI
jgi:hypothetical protein